MSDPEWRDINFQKALIRAIVVIWSIVPMRI